MIESTLIRHVPVIELELIVTGYIDTIAAGYSRFLVGVVESVDDYDINQP